MASATQSTINKVTVGLFGAAAGGYMNDLAAFYFTNGNSQLKLVEALVNSSAYRLNVANWPSLDNAGKAAAIVGTLLNKTTGDAYTQGVAAAKAALDAGQSYATVASNAITFISTTTDTVYGPEKTAFAARVSNADAYTDSGRSSTNLTELKSAVNPTTGEAGVPTVLTVNQDIVNGTGVDDVFRSVAGLTTGVQDQTTLNSSDIIDGLGGNDTMIVNMTGGIYNGGARLKNIETLQVGSDIAAATFNLQVNAGSNEVTGVNTVLADRIITGEALTFNGMSTTVGNGTALPTLGWTNSSGNDLAGTVAVAYEQVSVDGATTVQNIELNNVRAGTLNIGPYVETLQVTAKGSVDSVVLLDSNTGAAGTATSQTTKVVVNANTGSGLGQAGIISTTAGTIGLEIYDNTVTNTQTLTSNTNNRSFVNVGPNVITVDAADATYGVSKGNVNVAFTDAATAKNNVFNGGEGNDSAIFLGGNDSAVGGVGNDNFIFAGTASSANGSFYNNSDSVDGSAGLDTITFASAANGFSGTGIVMQTSEWLNAKGIDALDVRATTSRIQLEDAFVGRADQSFFEVITNKIVQNDSTTSVANEAASRHLIELQNVAASRAIKVSGGEGRETVMHSDALDGTDTLSGGNNLDKLVITATTLGGATLTGQDLANVSGFNVFQFVKPAGTGATTFNVDLSAAIVTASIDPRAATGASAATTANLLYLTTDTTDANGAALTNIGNIGAGDTVNITVATAGLAVGAINVTDLLASGARVTIKDTAGVTILDNPGGVITASGIFAGATALAVTTETQLSGTGTVAGNSGSATGPAVGSANASGTAATPGSSSAAGGTFTLTAANAILTNSTNVNVTPATSFLSTGADTIVGAANLSNAFITDPSTGDGDVLSATITGGAITAPTITNIETLNLTTNQTAATSLLGVSAGTIVNISGGASNFSNVTGKTINLTSGYAAAATVTPTAATDNLTVNTQSTASGTTITVGSATGATFTINNTGTSTVSGVTMFTNADVLSITGSGALTLAAVNDGTAGTTTTVAAGYTGTINFTATNNGDTVTGGAGNDTITGGTAADSLSGGTGNDTINAGTGAAADTIVGGTGADTITLNVDATSDAIYMAFADVAAGTSKAAADTVVNFLAGAGGDAIDMAGAFVSAGAVPAAVLGVTGTDEVAAGQYLAEATAASTLANANKNGVAVLELTTAVTGDFTTQAGIDAAVAALVAAYTANAVANSKFLIAMYDSQTTANAAVFLYDEGAADGGIAASELSLVGVLNAVGAGNLTDANFA